jgi:hypothetical protein
VLACEGNCEQRVRASEKLIGKRGREELLRDGFIVVGITVGFN